MIKELEFEIKNTKAINFFGKNIVSKLEVQHQDNYPKYFKKIQNDLWQYGCTSKYIVNFNNNNYIVTVVDNILKHPLYVNVITNWEKVK